MQSNYDLQQLRHLGVSSLYSSVVSKSRSSTLDTSQDFQISANGGVGFRPVNFTQQNPQDQTLDTTMEQNISSGKKRAEITQRGQLGGQTDMPYSEEFEAKRDIMVSKITASPFVEEI